MMVLVTIFHFFSLFKNTKRGKTGMLERQLKHYKRGDMPEVEHLDKLCIAKIYDQLAKEEENMCRDKGLYLVQIELSHFPLPVLFQEQTVVGTGGIGMDNPSLLSQGSLNSQDSRSLETLHDILQAGHTLGQRVIDSHAQLQGGHQVIYVSDPEIGRENPAGTESPKNGQVRGPKHARGRQKSQAK